MNWVDRIMALLMGVAIGAAIISTFAATAPIWCGYACAGGFVCAEYWLYRIKQLY